jgi:transcriptional regulator with XRE-family HTH domain
MRTTLSRMTLPELLERYRVYTIREFSRRTGFSSQQAWQLWHGVAGLGRRTMQRLHETLGIPADELLQVTGPPRAPRRPPRRPLTLPMPEAALPPRPAAEMTPQARKAALITRLQALQAEGLSTQAIANRLNTEGVPTISGRGQWQKGTVANLLAQAEHQP